MGMLDFIKGKGQSQTNTAPTADKAHTLPAKPDLSQLMSTSELAKAREVGERIRKATIHVREAPAPTEGGNNAALLQTQNNQSKTQAALSPTDRFAGKTALQKPSRGWER